jgi:Spy/CpxP family protein refolding chaperone
MTTIRSLITAVCLAVPVLAQSPDSTSMLPVVPREFDAVRQYLVLTDAQMNQLREIQESRMRADQAIYEQIHQRQIQLNALLREGSNDAQTVGRLLVEINGLQRQLPGSGAPYRTRAVAVLTDAQKQKLATLVEALQLGRAAGEATALNLIESPRFGDPRILPFPAEAVPASVGNVR